MTQLSQKSGKTGITQVYSQQEHIFHLRYVASLLRNCLRCLTVGGDVMGVGEIFLKTHKRGRVSFK